MKTLRTLAFPALLLSVLSALTARAAVDVEPFERLIQQGQPEQAMALLARELERHPDHPRLLYDYGVAAAAARKYDEALLAFDKVEMGRSRALAEKARAQKGNAEFHLGLDAKNDNLDETIERWKNSVAYYRGALRDAPADLMAKNNHDIVEKLLMDLLLKNARQHLDAAHQKWMQGEPKTDELRNAMEKFQEAARVDETSEPAKQGEKQAREELAQELARQGERQARKPDQVNEWQVKEMEKGVNKLADANRLVPEDKPIEQKFEQARQNLADALAKLARQEIQRARQTNWDKDKFNQLDHAVEHAEQALEQKPEHQEAQQALEEAKDELAKLHEQKGDENVRDAEHASLQRTVDKLDSALDHYKEASGLKPQEPRLMDKAARTQEKLKDALQKLADKMMQDPPKEMLEEKAARLETAEHALQDLEQLKPSEKTEKQLTEAERRLARVREEMAALARERLQREAQQPQEEQSRRQAAQNTPPPDFEKMPAMTAQPLGKGDFKSDSMNKKTKDY